MSEHEAATAEIAAAIQAAIAPLREQLAKVDRLIAEEEAALSELKQQRLMLRGMIGKVDPAVPMRGRRSNNGPPKGSLKAGPETLDIVEGWLRENLQPGEVFTGPEVIQAGFTGRSDSMLSAALLQLHADGRILLDRIGKPGAANTKIYRMPPS